jgi:hypothetical protein
MKRSCHGNNFQSGGEKGHANLVENTILYGMEFHTYAFKIQKINNNIYV